MSKRREGREAAIQLLYSYDALPKGAVHDLAAFWNLRRTDEDVRLHAMSLFQGVQANLKDVDARISKALMNFSFERLAAVDRDILRLAVYEMHYEAKVPPVVAMNEAIEISKRFGGEDSSKFVNGVLDRLIKEVKRDLR